MRCSSMLALTAMSCTASSDEVRPDPNKISFPTGAAIAPDESMLFVSNANSDLRFDSGSISVLPLSGVDDVVAAWLARGEVADDCAQDRDKTETLNCTESRFLGDASPIGVRIGNFATELAVQDLGDGRLRLVVPTRGDPSITWVDWDGTRLSCNSSGEDFALCDDAHRLAFVLNDPELPSISPEPFGVFADSGGEFAIVTHLGTQTGPDAVTLVDSPKHGDAVVADFITGVFATDEFGNRGATGVAGRTPKTAGDIVYVGSRSEDRVKTFTVGRPVNGAAPFLLDGGQFILESAGEGNELESTDTRGMVFSPSGDRLYLVNRRPPTLQSFDTSIGETGTPRNVPIGVTDICRLASTVAVADTGNGERVYISCFQDGQIYIVDPSGRGRIEDIVTVGRGPYTVVASSTRKKLYVTNFLDDTIAVVDLDPVSSTYNHVVLRIGVPRSQ